MTYGEIIDTLKSYSKNKQNQLRERALMDYRLADLIAMNVAKIIDKDSKIPTLVEVYDFLFPEEKKLQDEIRAKNEMEIWKQRMVGYAENHNRKWGEDR